MTATDELRELANKLLEHGAFIGFGGTVNTDPMMLDAGTAMIDAAELILELRDDLQRANAAVQDAEHDESMAWDRVRKAESENAKLRELVRDYHTFLALAELAQPIGHIVAAHGHPTLSIAALDERYRELGVEVDG